jgi:hypothetical protein
MYQRPLAALAVLCAAASACAGATDPITLRHDRNGWTATIRGSFSASDEMRIVAGGDVTICGTGAGTVSYAITRRFDRGTSEAQARGFARQIAAAIRAQQHSTTITFADSRQFVRMEMPRRTARLYVTSVAGDIDVTGVDGAVFTRNGAGQTSLDQIGGDAEIQTAGGCTTLGLIGGNLHCVSGGGAIRARTIRGAAVFETSGGEIYAAEALGPVRAFTGAGRIRIGRAGSSVTATTQGGAIEIGRAAGMVVANNSGGPIQVASAPAVRCETSAGAIRLAGITSSVIATTSLGDIIASLLGARLTANSVLQTGNGDITVSIPSNVSVTLQATTTTGSGRIRSEFPLRVTNRGALLIAEGPVNGGGPLLRIAGKGGTIFIKRQ